MIRFLFPVLAVVLLSLTAPAARAQDGIFRDYDELRATLDDLMKARRIDDVLISFGGSDEMTQQQLTALRQRVEALFPQDFEQVETLKQVDMNAGWRQELLVYYTGTNYLYVYMLLHDRGDRMISVNFKFDSNFDNLNKLF